MGRVAIPAELAEVLGGMLDRNLKQRPTLREVARVPRATLEQIRPWPRMRQRVVGAMTVGIACAIARAVAMIGA